MMNTADTLAKSVSDIFCCSFFAYRKTKQKPIQKQIYLTMSAAFEASGFVDTAVIPLGQVILAGSSTFLWNHEGFQTMQLFQPPGYRALSHICTIQEKISQTK